MKIGFALLTALAVTACADRPPLKYLTREPFSPQDVAWSTVPGANSLSGSVLFEYWNNQPRPCAEVPVRLVPDSAYARRRLQELYGSDAAGVSSGPGYGGYGPEKFDFRWLESGKTADCNQGSYSFEGVADGTWYVVSSWMMPGDKDGRGVSMFKRVELRGGHAVQLNLP